MKKISIITICFNAATTIEETILSVVNQDYNNLEYIIIDGGSTDGTIEIINKYINKISYYKSEPDKGISDAFNKGIEVATGEIIGIINADDLYYKDSLKKVSWHFDQNNDIDVTFGDFLLFSNGEYWGRRKTPNTNLNDLKLTFELCHPTVFVRKKAYEKYGNFSLEYKLAMDFDLLSKMYFNGANFSYINEIISCYRSGGISETSGNAIITEHKNIAYRNGSSSLELFILFAKRKVKNISFCILKKLHLYYFFRKKLRPAETYNVIWWNYDDKSTNY